MHTNETKMPSHTSRGWTVGEHYWKSKPAPVLSGVCDGEKADEVELESESLADSQSIGSSWDPCETDRCCDSLAELAMAIVSNCECKGLVIPGVDCDLSLVSDLGCGEGELEELLSTK